MTRLVLGSMGPGACVGGQAGAPGAAFWHGYADRMATTAGDTSTNRIEAQLKSLPAKPGVYLFRDAKDGVLYVGKAASLRPRVRSYFRGGDTRLGLDRMVERVERIEVILTQSAGEALHLEQNLIKRHRPPFNVRLRDDKSYPVHRRDRRGRLSARHVHTRAPPARSGLFRPLLLGEEAARDARRSEPRLSVSALRRPSARAALGDPVPRLPHRPLPGPVRRLRLEGGLRSSHRRRHRVPFGEHRADAPGTRAPHERGRRGTTVRGGCSVPKPPLRRPASGRAPGRGQEGDRDRRRARHRRSG